MKRRSSLILITAAALVVAFATAAYGLGEIVGDGNLEKASVVVVKNSSGQFNASGTVYHYAEAGQRKATFTIDIKDKSVLEANYVASSNCYFEDGDPVWKPYDGMVTVEKKEKGEFTIKLPRKHTGCDLSMTALVLRPGQGIVQTEMVLKKMVLTIDAE